MSDVVFVTRLLTHYRTPFHALVRDGLAVQGVRYRLLHSDLRAREHALAGPAFLDWAERVPAITLGPFAWQQIIGATRRADLVIVGQENGLLANYALMARRRLGGAPLALFGHGRNWQSPNPNGLAERFKRAWIGEADWWFAYTERCAAAVREAGYPAGRITVFNNAIDTAAIRAGVEALDPVALGALRSGRYAGSRNIAVQLGTLHGRRRPDFLLAAADLVRREVPDFQLVVIGDGPERGRLRAAGAGRPWLHLEGALYGTAKSQHMALAAVQLLPGLVGLGILDGFAHGLPALATRYPYHSPEIDYLVDGSNGLVTPDDPRAYAEALVALLRNPAARAKMADEALRTAGHHTISAMAERFVAGTVSALAANRQQRTKTVTVG
jgi:glycosyltransferase involved in cell wall biosynthesis